MSREDTLVELIKPVVQSLDCQLWGLELLPQGRHALLRIYIDKATGIMLEDCEKVSRQVSSVLDVEDPIAGQYTLEVSSPGMDRPLFELSQYQDFIGQKISLRLHQPFDGRRKLAGQLTSIENDEVAVVVDDHEYVLPFELIDKAKVVPTF